MYILIAEREDDVIVRPSNDKLDISSFYRRNCSRMKVGVYRTAKTANGREFLQHLYGHQFEDGYFLEL